MDQEILKVFFYDVRCAVVMHLSAWSAVYYNGGVGRMMIRCYSPDHLVLQVQPHVISFYGVTSRSRFMFLLFPHVSRN